MPAISRARRHWLDGQLPKPPCLAARHGSISKVASVHKAVTVGGAFRLSGPMATGCIQCPAEHCRRCKSEGSAGVSPTSDIARGSLHEIAVILDLAVRNGY